jgi:hypothetical protein
MSDHDLRSSPEPDERELRESAIDIVSTGAAVIGAAASVGSLGLAVRQVRNQERQAAQQRAALAAMLDRQTYDPGFGSETDYYPGFGEPPIDFRVDCTDEWE